MIAELSAEIYAEPSKITVDISISNGTLECSISQSSTLNIDYNNIEYVLTDKVKYNGDYIVVPKPNEEQVLETKDKFLDDNVTVREIPFFKVSNNNGSTIYIGKEIKINGYK